MTISENDIPKYRSNSRRNRVVALLVFLPVPLQGVTAADIAGDEDETQYEMAIGPSFKDFHRKFKRYPRNWTELQMQTSCGGYSPSENKHFPRRDEAIIWKPSECELSYKIAFSSKTQFRVIALARGRVVSAYENYRATYFKTPYHIH